MRRSERSRLAFGILLILIGVLFLAARAFPILTSWIQIEFTWPLIIIAVAVFLLLLGLLVGAPDMAVPACVVAGIGGILYWQNLTGQWESWEYVWTLLPGFVGVGILLSAILGGASRGSLSSGIWLILISLTLFAVFGSFFGGLAILGPYWPVLLILLGIAVFIRALPRKQSS
jgi:hypothetical protein